MVVRQVQLDCPHKASAAKLHEPRYLLKAAITMNQNSKKNGLLIAVFALLFLSHSAVSETVFKCRANVEGGYTFSVVIPEKFTEYIATVDNEEKVEIVDFVANVGVGSITFDNMGGRRWGIRPT